jgi:hypothetical protein
VVGVWDGSFSLLCIGGLFLAAKPSHVGVVLPDRRALPCPIMLQWSVASFWGCKAPGTEYLPWCCESCLEGG